MELKFIYPRWGSADIDWGTFLNKVKANGFSGVEIDLPFNKQEKHDILLMLKDFELDFIGQHWQTKDVDFKTHKENYKSHLYNLVEAKPLFVNSHTGMDFFTFEQNAELIEIAQAIEAETKVVITHETHRSRFSFAAHVCYKYLESLPFLKLTSDISHWCCVAETLLENQENALQKAIQHTYHIHARVGSSQSAQVIDPRDSVYVEELNQFNKWWTAMIENAAKSSRQFITITTEYGPFPYTLYQPNTETPLGNQWDINLFVKNEIQRKWNL
ncbi:sugar phosphate isomerase/epimerase [Jejuia spongiicola]|uniref:Sugar phosphate isomerase/epimerase n=1 Tax=Jejuia spongiicola TaxID=2942207 RepID=A0ABT0QE99_9FLAO|nr:sugar phosphate isomerase/epimerase [Jejuia spongiicola]MCL6294295.1 sugar phosphate isomerase/epimerase [Jejuia spongiicola]